MSGDKPEKLGVSVSVGPDQVRADVSEGALSKIGDSVAWLFTKKDAKAKITAALAARVSEKIKSGDGLDEHERWFVGLVFEKEARAIANQQEVADRVQQVLPEVSARMAQLPPVDEPATSRTFIGRAETIASEAMENEIREWFARVLAGELCRPGSFLVRTLETVRAMDRELASIFEKARRLAFDNKYILTHHTGPWIWKEIGGLIESRGLTEDALLELKDAGLIDGAPDTICIDLRRAQETILRRYQDRMLRFQVKPAEGEFVTNTMAVEVIRLTRTGRQIASVLPAAPDEEYFERAGRLFCHYFSVDWKRESEEYWRGFLHP